MSYKALFYDEGVFSSRPAASVGDSYVYFATDTGNLYRSNGSTWTLIGSTGGSGATFGTPALSFGTSNTAGSTDEVIRRDAGIAIFDATSPTTQAFGDSAAVGSAAFAARRDHKHAMPATPVTSFAKSGGSALTGAVTISAGTGITLTPSGNDIAIATSGGAGGGAPIGTPELIYRYEVTGSDKASIDTGVDTAQAGSNDWTNGDVLEIWIYARSDSVTATDTYNIVFNNDTTSGNYRVDRLQLNNTTVSGSEFGGSQTSFQITSVGGGDAANNFGCIAMTFPNYAGTVGHKAGEARSALADDTAGNAIFQAFALRYKSTSALSRFKISSNTAGKLLKVGFVVLIYKRRNA